MNKIKLDQLPWDLIGIIMEYTPRKQVYPVLRGVNVQFSRLIAKRVKGLTIAKPEIT